jgi:enterochelin esterase-like enzyme
MVYLPACFEETEEEIGSLYLLHGYPFDENHWLDLGVVEVANRQIGAGAWPNVIIIMPRQPEPLFRGTDGGKGSYEEEFLEGLIPYIQRTYSVDGPRAIVGISRGGIWSLEIGLRNMYLFYGVGAFSPALAVNAAAPEYNPFELVRTLQLDSQRILLLYGDSDWAKTETVRLGDLMQELGISHSSVEVPGGHLDSTWAQALQEGLGLLLNGFSK